MAKYTFNKDNIDCAVFARRAGENYYYPGLCMKKSENQVLVQFLDGMQEWVHIRDLKLLQENVLSSKRWQCNWYGKGKYYPCVPIDCDDDGSFTVGYEDGSRENNVDIAQLRLY